MVLLLGTFLVNVLCAIVPCEKRFEGAEILLPEDRREARQTKFNDDNGFREDYPIVLTNDGKLQGYTQTTTDGRQIYAFESIPYGTLLGRFQPAERSRPWKGIRQAMKPSPYCLQVHPMFMFRIIGQEDCLYLNVYTPELPSANNKSTAGFPVVAMIHGGSFEFGSGSEVGAAYLLNQDVVLVSISYRVGPYGFLSTGDAASPGNYGLKDQALGLKWIEENIHHFNGNPSGLQLFGWSAGGVSVHHHLIYNKESRRNFAGAVSLSGTSFVHWAVQSQIHARKMADRLARLVKCPVQDSHQMMACLRTKNPNKVVAAQMDLFDFIPFPPVLFLPVLEPPGPNAFITDRPQDVYARDDVAKVPWITSVSAHEGHVALYLLKVLGQYRLMRRKFDEYAPGLLNYRYLLTDDEEKLNLTSVSDKIRKFYFKGVSPLQTTDDMYSDMIRDRYFTTHYGKAMKLHSKIAPTYGYIVKYNTTYTGGKYFGLPQSEWGPGHGEDIAYYTNFTVYLPGFRRKDPEYKLSQILINIMTNFFKTGKPQYTDAENVTHHIWDPVSSTNDKILQVDNDIQMVPFPYTKNSQFWESLGFSDTEATKTENNHNFTDYDDNDETTTVQVWSEKDGERLDNFILV